MREAKMVGAVLGALLGSWATGRVLHLFGARHTGAHVLAETLVLSAVLFLSAWRPWRRG